MSFPVLGVRRLGTGVFIALDQLHLIAPDGRPTRRDVVRHPGGVGILPIDGADVLFVSQYRIAFGERMLEIPAGKLDRIGESPRAAAERELEEEIGASAPTLIPLGTLAPSPGYTDEVIHLFAAPSIVPGNRRPEGAEEHDANTVRMPLTEAYRLVDAGEIVDSKTQIALMAWSRRTE
ncbi:MAG: NUDIX hydrolase [Acidimicrobiia bacterium]|nr:NUDIX hydrolase [Acidimicrobiia bacterium]